MNYVKIILEKLQSRQNIFLTGGAGVGKTTTTRAIIEAFEQDAKKVAKLASTGMAATLIGGQTLHSFFGNVSRYSLDGPRRLRSTDHATQRRPALGFHRFLRNYHVF